MNIVAFKNNGIAIGETCWIEGKPYFTSRAIGELLEAPNPYKYVRKIVERNSYIKTFSTIANLAIVEGGRSVTRNVEVFDPIGLQLIVMESHQPKALQYKVAVAQLVWAYMNGQLKPSQWSQRGDLVAASRQILSLPQGRERAELVRDLAEREGISLQTAYRRISQATGERLQTTKGRPINRRTKGTSLYPEEKRQVLAYVQEHPEARGRLIKATLRLQASESRINCWIRENKINTKPNRQQAGM